MSKYHGNHKTCPGCGMRYGDFRTGFTFREVYHMIFDRPHKRRRGVLGCWHDLKRQMWRRHVDYECERQAQVAE